MEWIRHHLFDIYLIILSVWAFLEYGAIRCYLFGHKTQITHQTEVITADGRRVMYASQWGCFRCSKGGPITYTNKADKK